MDAGSQHDNSTSKCGSGSYRQSAVCSRRIFRYGDEFGVVGRVMWVSLEMVALLYIV